MVTWRAALLEWLAHLDALRFQFQPSERGVARQELSVLMDSSFVINDLNAQDYKINAEDVDGDDLFHFVCKVL